MKVAKEIDKKLSRFYNQKPYEPENKITEFDKRRLYYVALSRAQDILVLTCDKQPKEHIRDIYNSLLLWLNEANLEKQRQLRCESLKESDIKRSYSITGDVTVLETCPRQYQLYKQYGFTPSRTAAIYFGTIVHQTIEDIHRTILQGGAALLNEEKIKEFYEYNHNTFFKQGTRALREEHKELALEQCLRYFRLNKEYFSRIHDAELDVSVEKENYILTSVIDLIMGENDKLQLLDFKTQTKPEDLSNVEHYKRQLAVYSNILNKKYGKYPEKAVIY